MSFAMWGKVFRGNGLMHSIFDLKHIKNKVEWDKDKKRDKGMISSEMSLGWNLSKIYMDNKVKIISILLYSFNYYSL